MSRTQLSVTDISLDANCGSLESFQQGVPKSLGVSPIGGMFAHVITSNYPCRMIAIDALRRRGVKVERFWLSHGIHGEPGEGVRTASTKTPSESCAENGDRTTPPETLGVFKTALCQGTEFLVH